MHEGKGVEVTAVTARSGHHRVGRKRFHRRRSEEQSRHTEPDHQPGIVLRRRPTVTANERWLTTTIMPDKICDTAAEQPHQPPGHHPEHGKTEKQFRYESEQQANEYAGDHPRQTLLSTVRRVLLRFGRRGMASSQSVRARGAEKPQGVGYDEALFLGLALFGYASLWLAILADTGATLLVVANALRLLRPSRAN